MLACCLVSLNEAHARLSRTPAFRRVESRPGKASVAAFEPQPLGSGQPEGTCPWGGTAPAMPREPSCSRQLTALFFQPRGTELTADSKSRRPNRSPPHPALAAAASPRTGRRFPSAQPPAARPRGVAGCFDRVSEQNQPFGAVFRRARVTRDLNH